MFMITYNCRGYNSIKACFIKKLLSQCDVLFNQEHWLLRDKLHLLQNISEEFIVFSKSSIDDGKLLIGRPYGGTAIFIRKSIKSASTDDICAATAIRELCNERDTCNMSDVHAKQTKHIIDRLFID